ncbi:MAG: DUF1697 domain-containing protein [Ahniella sp.]|nr:DUF1697 domain-containing protein [Ahniella sp.]
MPTFVALLRGINVGKAKRVAMAELRALLSELGYSKVSTLLNSGNAVFNADTGTPEKLAHDISNAISSRLSLDVPVIVKSLQEPTDIVAGNSLTFEEQDFSRLMVAFTQDPGTLAGLVAIEPLVVAPEQFLIGRNAAYLHCASGILESKAAAALLGKIGKAVTTRNWATVLKLMALADAA